MANTYSGDMAIQKDRLRFRLDDTQSPWLFSDEEITGLLAQYTSESTALAQLASAALIKLAKMPDVYEEDGTLKVEWKNRFAAYQALAKQAQSETVLPGEVPQGPVAGVLTVPDLSKLRY